MVSRKRARAEVEEPEEDVTAEPSTLERIRNMWQFASLMQYLFLFGKAVKVEEIDVEVRSYLTTLIQSRTCIELYCIHWRKNTLLLCTPLGGQCLRLRPLWHTMSRFTSPFPTIQATDCMHMLRS